MKKDELGKNLNTNLGLLKDLNIESGHLYDALTSIGENIATAINNAVEGSEHLNDTGKAIANTYKRDIVNSIKASARGLEKHIGFAHKIACPRPLASPWRTLITVTSAGQIERTSSSSARLTRFSSVASSS